MVRRYNRYRFGSITHEKFWKCNQRKARSICSAATSWGKRNGVKMVAKVIDNGVWVFNQGVVGG